MPRQKKPARRGLGEDPFVGMEPAGVIQTKPADKSLDLLIELATGNGAEETTVEETASETFQFPELPVDLSSCSSIDISSDKTQSAAEPLLSELLGEMVLPDLEPKEPSAPTEIVSPDLEPQDLLAQDAALPDLDLGNIPASASALPDLELPDPMAPEETAWPDLGLSDLLTQEESVLPDLELTELLARGESASPDLELPELLAQEENTPDDLIALPEIAPAAPETEEPEPLGLMAAIPEENPSDALEDIIADIDTEMQGSLDSAAAGEPGRPSKAINTRDDEQYVIFALAGTEYAAPLANVIEVGRLLAATAVPNVPDWVLGVTNLRGDIISLVDLKRFLGLPPVESSPTTRMLVGRSHSEDIATGLIVDRVSGVRFLPVKQIKPPAAPINDQVAPYLRGVYEHEGKLLAVLDLDQLLLSHDLRQFEPT